MKELRVVELFSGIGGLHLALRDVPQVGFEVVASYDINTAANAVYRHNFPDVLLQQRNILSITSEELDNWKADVYLLSPPCQPFTRQGKRLDTVDNRTNSLMHLLGVFSRQTRPPQFILLENVKGFEVSTAHRCLLDYLLSAGYFYREFLLSPVQFGIPNSRLRYYLVAKLATEFTFGSSEEISHEFPCASDEALPLPLSIFMEDQNSDLSPYIVPDKILAKYGEILDIVTTKDRRSCCFTKGYGHYVEGTGSMIQAAEETSRDDAYTAYRAASTDVEKADCLRPLQLRYFTPRELANLMCFPTSFEFPPDTSTRQRYRLLGNSVNVRVVNQLVKLLVGSS